MAAKKVMVGSVRVQAVGLIGIKKKNWGWEFRSIWGVI